MIRKPHRLVTDERRAYSDLGYGRRIVLGAIGLSPTVKSAGTASDRPAHDQEVSPDGRER